jgi:two-component system cell cycle sensor histidine kinase/response regulator CckA
VLAASGRAKDLVQQILTFSRQAESVRKPVKIAAVVTEALKLIRGDAARQR